MRIELMRRLEDNRRRLYGSAGDAEGYDRGAEQDICAEYEQYAAYAEPEGTSGETAGAVQGTDTLGAGRDTGTDVQEGRDDGVDEDLEDPENDANGEELDDLEDDPDGEDLDDLENDLEDDADDDTDEWYGLFPDWYEPNTAAAKWAAGWRQSRMEEQNARHAKHVQPVMLPASGRCPDYLLPGYDPEKRTHIPPDMDVLEPEIVLQSNFKGYDLLIRTIWVRMDAEKDAVSHAGSNADSNADHSTAGGSGTDSNADSDTACGSGTDSNADSSTASGSGTDSSTAGGSGKTAGAYRRVQELYLGKHEKLRRDGTYHNTDHSLIYISQNVRLAGLMCGHGYMKTQEDLTDSGVFAPEDFREYDDLRYGKLKKLDRHFEVRFDLEDEDDNGMRMGLPMRTPHRDSGTADDMIHEVQKRGASIYYDFMRVKCDLWYRTVLLYQMGPGFIVIGEQAENCAAHAGAAVGCMEVAKHRRRAVCAIPQEQLQDALRKLRRAYNVALCVNGTDVLCVIPDYASGHKVWWPWQLWSHRHDPFGFDTPYVLDRETHTFTDMRDMQDAEAQDDMQQDDAHPDDAQQDAQQDVKALEDGTQDTTAPGTAADNPDTGE